ncbi:MAG: glycoside hydrolase family 5 protein, partial [Paludibacteraceae bacterium]|nr:glycoside hydrolase family 5 protein [Paludibacteraceae bacterium]
MKKVLLGLVTLAFFALSSCKQDATKQAASTADSVASVATESKYVYPEGSPVAKYGKLKVNHLQLCDQYGVPVQLAGLSTMGWQWCGDCYNRESIEAMKNDWNINILRLAMYVEEGGYNTTPEATFNKLCEMIDICGELGIYCIVDWHILTPGNPLAECYSGAKDFFQRVSSKYAGADHVLYELCNEPNNCQEKNNPEKPWECTREENVTWDMIAEYANGIIPLIHANADSVGAPHPIIIVGTPQWCQLVDASLKEGMYQGNGKDLSDPLPARDARLKYDNIMYTFHFYALEHKESVDDKPGYYNFYSYMYDVLNTLPVFCTEYGVTFADGDRGIDLERTDKWLLMFQGN